MLSKFKNKHKYSEKEVIRDWTLSLTDKDLVYKLNISSRIWFCVQLCALKLYGRLLKDPNQLSPKIINYVCQQLRMGPVITIEKPRRKATYIEHRKLIFKHLKFSHFDEKAMQKLKEWVTDKIDMWEISVDQLYSDAEYFLVQDKIALPSIKQLRRFISSICAQYQQNLYEEVYKQIHDEIKIFIEKILTSLPTSRPYWFQEFKEYQDNATITVLKKYLKVCFSLHTAAMEYYKNEQYKNEQTKGKNEKNIF